MPVAEPENGPQPTQQPAAAASQPAVAARPPWELDSALVQEPGTAAESAWGPAGTEADSTPQLQPARTPREVPRLARGQAFEPGIGYAAAPVPADVTGPPAGNAALPPGFGSPQATGPQTIGMQGTSMPATSTPATSSPATGSLYVWNPAASTDAFPAIRLDANGNPIPPDNDQPGSTGAR